MIFELPAEVAGKSYTEGKKLVIELDKKDIKLVVDFEDINKDYCKIYGEEILEVK